jgi:DNA-binding NarL/FixJ family response regulator
MQPSISRSGESAMKHTRALLADDHPLTLEGLRVLLQPRMQSVDTVTDGRALVEAALRLNPDLIVLDLTMPLLNGIDAAVQIKKSLPDVKLVFVTMHANPAYLEAALNAGAMGYVLKSSAHEELLMAIESVLDGRIYVTPSLSREHLERFQDPARAASTLRLSTREREVLQLIAEGKLAKEIGYILGISVKTVAFHRENLRRKLGLNTTAELTKHALEQGLIS